MSADRYIVFKERLLGSEELIGASADELRVLTVLLCLEGERFNIDEICALLSLSHARVNATLCLFEDCGIIARIDTDSEHATVLAEFDADESDKIVLKSAKEVAGELRDGNLATMMEALSEMMEQPSFSQDSIKKLTYIYTELGLSVEFILKLASFIVERGAAKLTPAKLHREADKLAKQGIDTVEDLEIYISNHRGLKARDYEYARAMGMQIGTKIGSRDLEFFKKWDEEYGYSTAIVERANDITLNQTHKQSTGYTDAILGRWHEAGCRTLADVEALIKRESTEHEQSTTKKASSKSRRVKETPEGENVTFTGYTSEEAMLHALKRSYGDPFKKD